MCGSRVFGWYIMLDSLLAVGHRIYLSHQHEFWAFISIPFVAAIVTWVHVWFAMKMVFYPLEFVGIWKPWIGWQGIVPRKAGKMAAITVDNTLAKLGTLDEVFREMEPELIAKHISNVMLNDVENFIDEIMNDKNHVLWENLPNAIKKRVYARVRRQLPDVMDRLVKDMSENIEDLMDLKHMVVTRLEADKGLMVRTFQEVGNHEIAFVVNSSMWIGFIFGIIQMVLWSFWPYRWGLPLYGAALGYLTNWVAINMVFRPLNPVYIGPWKLQGVFLKRQNEVAEKFSQLSTEEMMTIRHIMTEVMTGKRADRTRAMVKRHLAPLLESGVVRTAIQLTVGPQGYADLKRTVVDKATLKSLEPLQDPQFNKERAQVIARIFSVRMKAMTPSEFQDLLRPAFQEDEWIIVVLGGIFGFVAGWIQFVVGFQ